MSPYQCAFTMHVEVAMHVEVGVFEISLPVTQIDPLGLPY